LRPVAEKYLEGLIAAGTSDARDIYRRLTGRAQQR